MMKKFRFRPLEVTAAPFDPKESLPGVVYDVKKGFYIDTPIDGRVYLADGDWILYNRSNQPIVISALAFEAFFEEIP